MTIRGTLSPLFPIAEIVRDAPFAVQDILRNGAYETHMSGARHDKDIDILHLILCIFACPARYGEKFNDTPMTNDVMADHLYKVNLIDDKTRLLIKHGTTHKNKMILQI